MKSRLPLIFALLLGAAVPASAQLGLPPVGGALDRVTGTLGSALDRVGDTAGTIARNAADLARERTARLAELLRRHGDAIEVNAAGAPARRGELLALDLSPQDLARARASGFAALESQQLGELGLTVTRLAVPPGMPLAKAERALRQALPEATISADTLNFPAGAAASAPAKAPAPPSGTGTTDLPVGVIDGAPGPGVGAAAVQGFARGAPLANDHGSAVASLLRRTGARRVLVADVYGSDPAGGNALAIGRGVDWLLRQRVRVISISLVGPANPLLERALGAAMKRGVVLVAAVGNDGPAAPPAYPASYPGVIAVTGVDGRNRALIEAGRALHLDYAAPGADMTAANAAGQWLRVRGTSYAAPLVAARAALALDRGAPAIAALDREAIDLGGKGADRTYGRGLVCGACRAR
ncbi:S8 family serine peptidase [Novosphingobium flavum]|uniref:S8 family serine peptidase n=1 Tax=Novosphingobium flavum TaxID=1778672 RepID=A0A7X1KM13_9SPHN|nr:S8 family serine peptidase [Novosphingobium flavum]MBC2666147.1 S8 family serine peptidase [Novosphingobium flavum]